MRKLNPGPVPTSYKSEKFSVPMSPIMTPGKAYTPEQLDAIVAPGMSVITSDDSPPFEICTGTAFPVNARKLHTYLDIGRDFPTWMLDRIAKFKLVEGVSYKIDSPNPGNQSGRGGDRKSKEYWLTKRAAKHLAADVNSDRGRVAISYLVDRDEKLEEIEKGETPVFQLPRTFSEALRALADSEEGKEQLKLELREESTNRLAAEQSVAEKERDNMELLYGLDVPRQATLLFHLFGDTRHVLGMTDVVGMKFLQTIQPLYGCMANEAGIRITFEHVLAFDQIFEQRRNVFLVG